VQSSTLVQLKNIKSHLLCFFGFTVCYFVFLKAPEAPKKLEAAPQPSLVIKKDEALPLKSDTTQIKGNLNLNT